MDPLTMGFVPAGQYSELIPPSAIINPSQLITGLVGGALLNLGLNELFSALNFSNEDWMEAFAMGFSTSIANAAVSEYIETGSLEQLDASDVERATWAGATSSLQSADATAFFQGGDGTTEGAQEFFGSGAQSGLISFTQSEGDFAQLGAGAVGGMLNSQTTEGWVNDADAKPLSQIMRGAGVGAVESSMTGVFTGDLSLGTVIGGAAGGAISTNAFAAALPFTGDDPKNSAMYGAFNGAFSSAVSGGDFTSTMLSAGGGALRSNQVSGEWSGFGKAAAGAGYGAGSGLIQGQSTEAVGMGALSSGISYGMGQGTGYVSDSVSTSFQDVTNGQQAGEQLADETTAENIANDEEYANDVINATALGLTMSEYYAAYGGGA
jgi:hypothetical protein